MPGSSLGRLRALLVEAAAPSGDINGTVANASSATTLTTVAGTQTHQGAVSNAASATATSAPAGTQSYAGAVSNAATATALSTPAGSQALQGVVSNAASATSESTPSGTQEHQGAAANAESATAAGTAEGTQSHQGTVSAAGTATALSTPAGELDTSPNVAGATSGTELSSVAGQYVPPEGQQVAGGISSSRKRRALGDYESEWERLAWEAIEQAQGKTAKARRKVKRQAARDVYFEPLPDVAQAYVDRLKAEQEEARLAEMRALLDLQVQTSAVRAEIAHAAAAMARKQQQRAAQQLEEFDVMYVAAILATA